MIAAKKEIGNTSDHIVFGLTGGIACGKSYVASLLRKNLIPVVDADEVAREVVKPDSIGLEQLVEAFGNSIIKDGVLDRPSLAEMVFGKPDEMTKLNTIMQPLIAEHSAYLIRLHLLAGCQYVCYDAALIVELGLADQYRPLIVVSCSPKVQMARLLERGATEEHAKARIASQLTTEEKIAYADMVIDTNGTKAETEEQVKSVVEMLTS